MKKLFLSFFAFSLVVILAIPAFASITPLYYEFYEGVQLPLYLYNPEYDEYINLRVNDFEDMNMLLVESSTFGHVLYGFSGDVLIDDVIANNYKLTSSEVGEMHLHESGEYWVVAEMHDEFSIWCSLSLKWSNFDLVAKDGKVILQADSLFYACDGSSCPSTDLNKDNVCDDCGFKFVVERDYSPFTVKKFMNHIGQIVTSAVSWVGDVGSTILKQPLLLAFTALPLCGLGIAVFRRLKNTV